MPTEGERLQIVTLKEAGWTWRQISDFLLKKFGKSISRSTCQFTYRKWKNSGSVQDSPRSGRPKKLNKREERALKRYALSDRTKSAQQLANDLRFTVGKEVGPDTVLRVLKRRGLRRRVAARRPLLTLRMRMRRVAWAKRLKIWTVYDWKRVLFSDEKIFRLMPNRRGVFVTRYKHERYARQCVQPTQKYSLEVHVWGVIGWNQVGPLKVVNGRLNAHGYRTEIVNDIAEIGARLKPDVRKFVFEQDGAPAHRAATVLNHFRDQGVPVLEWPGNSADISIIENLWSYVQNRVKVTHVTNKQQLLQAVQVAWDSVPRQYLHSLYRSMPSRLNELLKRRGGNTRY